MEPNEIIETTLYNSSYRHGVDEKRRVQIPAKWRPTKPGKAAKETRLGDKRHQGRRKETRRRPRPDDGA